MSEHAPVVILGGGLTGLSAAYHLGSIPGVVVERESEVGGLCRTHEEDGFAFDCTGHLLHLRDAGIRGLVERLLPDTFARHERRALIYSKGVYTPYPFQANLHGLPGDVVRECLHRVRRQPGAARAARRAGLLPLELPAVGRGDVRQRHRPAFHDSLQQQAVAHRPGRDRVRLGVLVDPAAEVRRGAARRASVSTVRGLGYNPTFLYPRRGGIRVLPESFAARCSDIRTGSTVASIDVGRRTVTSDRRLDASATRALISTLPLDRFIAAASGLPDDLPPAGRKLRAVRVVNISLGIDRAGPVGGALDLFSGAGVLLLPGRLPRQHIVVRGAARLRIALRRTIAARRARRSTPTRWSPRRSRA